MVDIPDEMYERRSSRRGSRLYRRGMRRYRRSRSPWSIVGGGIFLVLVSAGIGYDAYSANAGAAQSSYTQSRGIRENATVVYVNNDCYHGCNADITVNLPNSTDSVDINVPGSVNYSEGQTITVLVDPKDPGYAELPGRPSTTSTDTIWLVVIDVVVLGLGIAVIVRGVRLRLGTGSWRYVSA